MGSSHQHSPSGHAGARHRWRLGVAFVIIALFFVVELVAGLLADSLALLSDAGHMAADVVALGAALAATRIATRADPSGRRTFGSYRAEVFASGLAVLVMLGTAVYITIGAVVRLGTPVEVATGPMLVVGAVGLLVNLLALVLLRGGAGESLNVRGAYLEVVGDTAGSVGVLVAGVLVARTGEPVWDTAVAIAIAVFVAARALWLGREVLTVLGQHAPAGIDPQQVESALAELPGVGGVHDLHLWTLTSGMHVATAHLVADPGAGEVLARAQEVLRDGYGVEHATLQVETSPSACREISW